MSGSEEREDIWHAYLGWDSMDEASPIKQHHGEIRPRLLRGRNRSLFTDQADTSIVSTIADTHPGVVSQPVNGRFRFTGEM